MEKPALLMDTDSLVVRATPTHEQTKLLFVHLPSEREQRGPAGRSSRECACVKSRRDPGENITGVKRYKRQKESNESRYTSPTHAHLPLPAPDFLGRPGARLKLKSGRYRASNHRLRVISVTFRETRHCGQSPGGDNDLAWGPQTGQGPQKGQTPYRLLAETALTSRAWAPSTQK